jgi:hypothetical protein
MDVHSQTLKEILHMIEAFKSQMHDTLHNFQEGFRDGFCSIHKSLASMQEKCSLVNIMDEYHQEVYAWYALEVNCDYWYMDSCHFWDDNHFYILFDDSTPPKVENLLESKHNHSLHILLQFYYSPVVVNAFFVGSKYFDPRDQCQSLEHHSQLVPKFRYLQRGFHMSTWTWDPGSQWQFNYFNIVAHIYTWDLGSPVFFSIMVHNYP